jgi:hypothetical protein
MTIRTACAALAAAGLTALGVVPAHAATDGTPPSVHLNPGLSFRVGTILGDTTPHPMIGPVDITFTAADNTGIASLDAVANIFDYQGTNVGTWEVNDDPQARAMTPSVALNGSVLAQVTAYDSAGNRGTDTATYHPHLYQQGVFALTKGWRGGSRASWSGGTLIHSVKAGATATYQFTGRSVALIGNYGPDRGAARITLDSSPSTLVDTQGFTSNRAVVFSRRFSAAGPHSITVVAASSVRFDIDAVVVQD